MHYKYYGIYSVYYTCTAVPFPVASGTTCRFFQHWNASEVDGGGARLRSLTRQRTAHGRTSRVGRVQLYIEATCPGTIGMDRAALVLVADLSAHDEDEFAAFVRIEDSFTPRCRASWPRQTDRAAAARAPDGQHPDCFRGVRVCICVHRFGAHKRVGGISHSGQEWRSDSCVR